MSLQNFEEALKGQREHPTVAAFRRDFPTLDEHLSGMTGLLASEGRGRIDVIAARDVPEILLVRLTNARGRVVTLAQWHQSHDALSWSDGRVTWTYPRVLGASYQEHGQRDRFLRAFNHHTAALVNG